MTGGDLKSLSWNIKIFHFEILLEKKKLEVIKIFKGVSNSGKIRKILT